MQLSRVTHKGHSGSTALGLQPRTGPKRGERLLSGGAGGGEEILSNHRLRNSTNAGLFVSAGITERDQSPIFTSSAFLLIEECVAQ